MAAQVRGDRAGLLAALIGLGVALGACGLGGPGGNAELAFSVDRSDPNLPILVSVEGPIIVGQEFLVRFEVNVLQEADFVLVRILNVSGQRRREIDEFRHAVEPPWNVTAIPITIIEPGRWSLSLIVNSRKITDVDFETRR